MKANRVSITEAKQQLGELVKRAAYGGERIVLEFRGRPKAALVSWEDLEKLEAGLQTQEERIARELATLERLRLRRERIAARTNVRFDSVADLQELRRERDDQLAGLS